MGKYTCKSERIYAFFLNLYPQNYKQEFGEEMKYVFAKSLKEASSGNGEGIYSFWVRTFTDTIKTLITQHFEAKKGGDKMKTKNTDLIKNNKIFAYLALATGLILLIPLIAMQLSGEMQWDLFDFIIMGALIFGTGFIFVHVARVTPRKSRTLIAAGFFLLLLFIWAELAVGIFTNLGA